MLKYCKKVGEVYYFSKRINKKYLVDSTKDVMFSKSLRVSASRFYHLLKDDNDFTKLSIFLNERITIFMKHKGKVDKTDLLQHINELCNDYYQSAIIENSKLELERIEALEYTNENGVQQGYSIQAISKEYKKIITQYDNLHDTEKTIEIGSQIVKRSAITKNEILEIAPSQLILFYEMLIKAERVVLENDIKLYISRNIHQFTSLISDLKKENSLKIEEAFHEYLSIVRENKPQTDYLNFIYKHQKRKPIEIMNHDDIINQIYNKMKIEEADKLLNTSVSVQALRDKFLEFKSYTEKRKRSATNAIRLFEEYLRGNGKEYKSKNIEDLTIDDVFEFENLLAETMPRSKAKDLQSLNIFQLIEKRKKENKARYGGNTARDIEVHIKDFWKYLVKYHKNLNLQNDTMQSLRFAYKLKTLKEENNEEDPDIRSFTNNELNTFINDTYGNKKLKKMLIRSPRNFYLFLFALLTGTRHEEALLIHISDIKLQVHDDKKYYYIYLNQDQTYQHLKGSNSHRNIPITNLMIELGLLSYINKRIKQKEETLFDFPKNASTSANAFFSRHIKKLFPDAADTRQNRDTGNMKNFIQFRSLRKNYSNFVYSKNVSEYYTDMNIKKLIGHDASTSGGYYGRLEPKIAYDIMNNVEFENEINFTDIKETVKEYFKEILTDLDIKDSSGDWNKVSKVSQKKGRKV